MIEGVLWLVEKREKHQLNVFAILVQYLLKISNMLGDKMKHDKVIPSKIPRPSRVLQMGILHHIECRFQDLVQIACSSSKDAKQQICRSKVLLLDIRHIILHQSFDYDLREKVLMRADAVVNYINSFMSALSRNGAHVSNQTLVGACA